MFCWLLPLLVKIDVATFEVNMTNHSQDIAKKQLAVPPYNETLLRNTYIDENYIIFFFKKGT